jgi:hypothetical protein
MRQLSRWAAVAASLVIGSWCGDTRANLLFDGGFESSPPGLHNAFHETFGAWFLESGSVEVKRDAWQNAEGRQSLTLNGAGAGVISYSPTVPYEPNTPYILTFAVAANPSGETGVPQRLDVVWGSQFDLLDTILVYPDGHSAESMGWTYHTYSFSNIDAFKLRFHGVSPNGGFVSPVIDAISFDVPEPSSIALVGMSLLIVGARRRPRESRIGY